MATSAPRADRGHGTALLQRLMEDEDEPRCHEAQTSFSLAEKFVALNLLVGFRLTARLSTEKVARPMTPGISKPLRNGGSVPSFLC